MNNNTSVQTLQEIHQFILSNLTQKKELLKISCLARRFSKNESELKKTFRQVYKSSIRQFIIKERMKIARKALMEGDLTISHIATLTGYEDLSNFSRDFKHFMGVSPTVFKTEKCV